MGTHDFIDDALVGVEVEGEAGVAVEMRAVHIKKCSRQLQLPIANALFLNQDTGRPLDCFRANATLSPIATSVIFRQPSSSDAPFCVEEEEEEETETRTALRKTNCSHNCVTHLSLPRSSSSLQKGEHSFYFQGGVRLKAPVLSMERSPLRQSSFESHSCDTHSWAQVTYEGLSPTT